MADSDTDSAPAEQSGEQTTAAPDDKRAANTFAEAHRADVEGPLDRSILLGMGGKWLSDWALRLAIFGIAGWMLMRFGGALWVGILPILLALIVCTLLWPIVRLLHEIKIPKALGALLSILGLFAVIIGTFAAVAPSVVEQSVDLANKATITIRDLQDWISGPPLNIEDQQIDDLLNEATSFIQSSGREIADGVFAGLGAVGSGLVTLLITLVLTFFFLKDGVSFLPWLRRTVGRTAGRHLTEVLTRAWNTLGGFIRAQAIVSFVDAFFIGLGLLLLGVPLAIPLAVITFFGGFIPIVGAFTAGALAVLVALVANGFTTALIVLLIVVAVQQLEGNILQPFLQSKAMNLHPVIVLLSVAAGTGLYGIIGAFLAVPVVATFAVVVRYIGEQVDLRTGEKSADDLTIVTEEGRFTALVGELSKTRFARRFRKVAGFGDDDESDGKKAAGKNRDSDAGGDADDDGKKSDDDPDRARRSSASAGEKSQSQPRPRGGDAASRLLDIPRGQGSNRGPDTAG